MSTSRSVLAALSLRVAIGALLISALGIAGIHLDLLQPLEGFMMFLFGTLVGGAVAALLALSALYVTRAGTGKTGRGKAASAMLLALLMGGVVTFAGRSAGPHPVLNDVSTDLDDPPVFTALRARNENAGRDMRYPEVFKEPVRTAYADVVPIVTPLAPAAALDAVTDAARQLGWETARRHDETGFFEATHTSGWFRFVDDIVVRVRAEGSGSRIDVRSKSRDGKDDFAVNANRIRAFSAILHNAS